METQRIFIAINPNAELLNHIKNTIRCLEVIFPSGVKWIDPKLAHVTITFLGNITTKQLDEITNSISKIVRKLAPFTLSLGPIRVVPNLKTPRVVWIALAGGRHQLQLLWQEVCNSLEVIGIVSGSRSFMPHITLGRVYQQTAFTDQPSIADSLEGLSVTTSGHLLKVTELMIVESILHKWGPRYLNRGHYLLTG